jgi:hypothetical protein
MSRLVGLESRSSLGHGAVQRRFRAGGAEFGWPTGGGRAAGAI